MIEIIATVLSIIGSVFVAVKLRAGFLFWIIANFLWVVFALSHGHLPMATLFVVYLITSIIGWFYWKEANNGKERVR